MMRWTTILKYDRGRHSGMNRQLFQHMFYTADALPAATQYWRYKGRVSRAEGRHLRQPSPAGLSLFRIRTQDTLTKKMPPYEKSMEVMPFKQRKCLATRKDEVCTIRSKFPNKLPVIVERYLREKKLPLLDKSKFLVPNELTLGQFVSLLRSKIALEASQALYLLVSGKNMSCLSASMGEVYSQFRDPDGFLYMTYASQDMFG
ncbi:microtubule-associated protein 1 light chain 3 gamma [Danio rerio]|uniref:Microtubule-associated protein 1 light chain 3 gamma n=2 Tax=Danio rerio TaxID=7955 RepID=A0AC58H8L2_DANRE